MLRATTSTRPATPACLARSPVSSRRLHVRAQTNVFEEVGSAQITENQLQAQRYVAMNRFQTQGGGAPARFEQRWANRPSRLAKLKGFKYFSLLRRVPVEEGGELNLEDGEPNYTSFTIWDDKSGFDEWRKGDAFKEAHGGGTIFGFVDMLVNSLQTLKGAPKPAFYDCLIPISMPLTGDDVPLAPGGWREVEADGKNTLDSDCFVAMNRFSVPVENCEAFEKRWASRDSKLEDCSGFRFFTLMRRDAPPGAADDSFNYVSTTVWKDRASFMAWRESTAFQRAHGASKEDTGKDAAAAPPPPLFSKPPSVACYEGVLMLTTEQGA
ncbi:hypothetical protein RI054_07g37740 [Pseudoscourfieldia marina]